MIEKWAVYFEFCGSSFLVYTPAHIIMSNSYEVKSSLSFFLVQVYWIRIAITQFLLSWPLLF